MLHGIDTDTDQNTKADTVDMDICIYLDIRLDMDKPLTFGLERPPTGGSKGASWKKASG